MARANFQSQFRRHGSFFSSTFWSALFLMPTYHEPDPAPGNGSIGPNEHTGLLNGHDSSPPPSVFNKLMWYRSDRRVWVRLPSEAFYLSYATLVSNYVNILLVLVPLGMASGAAGWNPTATFILNFFAIIPLASLLSFATEELAATLGETLGGLLNATFGNAVELIVSIIALQKNEIRIVQASMLGSILSNILLVLGCCFFIGASASLIIPATLYAALAGSKSDPLGNILILSHGTAIILLIVYIMYLYFQLKSHSDLFESRSGAALESQDHQVEETNGNPQILNPWAAGVLLLVVTVAVAICAEFLVGTIDNIVESANISRTFIGLILIPIVGNAAEHVTAIVVAYKNKMDLAIGVAIGSSLQIALFVTPFLAGLISSRYDTHCRHPRRAFFVSDWWSLLIQDGKSNYLKGVCVSECT
ncbi:vacuolar calcium ion transporter /H(+) exchanger [Coccidioides immitis RMSCC 3703]|uniref:Vacuolar calcium ion transporter /H(+) exchanger n=1 Tax=Coccidioides immitis RMSCC 3703 TaxID=454286 RepID=A0A0J8TV37_COCIT|nr:vacuolar calcium ion transporter /H(+) exchanger [Coccidioides immitis RMSCC 3703]